MSKTTWLKSFKSFRNIVINVYSIYQYVISSCQHEKHIVLANDLFFMDISTWIRLVLIAVGSWESTSIWIKHRFNFENYLSLVLTREHYDFTADCIMCVANMMVVAFVQHYENDIYLNNNGLAWKKTKI